MKIAWDRGHGVGQDRGASGFIAEEEIINAVSDLSVAKLRSLGHEVLEVRPNVANTVEESLDIRCARANGWGADIFISEHANAGGGTGAEVYTNNADKLVEAQRYLQFMLQEGLLIHSSSRTDINSGIKDGSDLAVINGTSMKAMLIENCFVDTQADVDFYRSHVESFANAAVYGITGVDLRSKSAPATQPQVPQISVKYQAHVQNVGWQNWVKDGEISGSTGKGLRMEGIVILLENAPADMDLEIYGHVQNIGWQNVRHTGEVAGTVGKELRLEAIKMKLINAPGYQIEYSAHVQNKGWLEFVKDGVVAGTTGQGLRLEALKVRVVKC